MGERWDCSHGCSPCPLSQGLKDRPATSAWQKTPACQKGFFFFLSFLFLNPVAESGGKHLCQLSKGRAEQRARGQQPRLAGSSVYLEGCFQRRLGGQRMGMLHTSAGAVNSCSCQHSLGFLPENRPAALQGLCLE